MRRLLDLAPSRGVAPAVSLCAFRQGEQVALMASGRAGADTLFDLASLTKPLAAAVLAAQPEVRGILPLERGLGEIWGPAVPAEKAGITLEMLLCHKAGFPAYRTYFDLLEKHPPAARKPLLKAMLMNEPLEREPGSGTVYSDLGYMLLGLVLEEACGRGLDSALIKAYQSLGVDGPAFRPLYGGASGPFEGDIAPCGPLPGRPVINGEVEDENAHALGGVAGHAGLFGSALQTASVMDALCRCLAGRGFWPAEAVGPLFRPCPGSGRTPGFDTPSGAGSAAGDNHPPGLVGHLGFTGTSLWWHPGQNSGVVLLTNRVALGRDNQNIAGFRRELHRAVWPLLGF